jgi:translation initiation factor 2 subunit 1
MAPQPVKIRTDFELTCFTYEGIDALKEALLTAKREVSEESFEVHVSYFQFLKFKSLNSSK